MTYTVNTTVDDDVFKDTDFFLSQLRNAEDFYKGCNESIVNILVTRTLRHSIGEVDVYYNITVGVKEENRTDYAALDPTTGQKIETCFETITNDILSSSSAEDFREHFQLPNISDHKPDGHLNDFVQTNPDCFATLLLCPFGSEEINNSCGK